jgi:hypothetical protein
VSAELLPIPGFDETEWQFVPPGPSMEPGYLKRYFRANAFPDATDGKTGATDRIFVPLSVLHDTYHSPEAIADFIAAQRDVAEASLRALFAARGVEFPE